MQELKYLVSFHTKPLRNYEKVVGLRCSVLTHTFLFQLRVWKETGRQQEGARKEAVDPEA